MAAQSPGFNHQFSHDGAPAAGFGLYAFVSGTNTPKNTFQDALEAAGHTHPIVLDDQGRVPGLGLFLLTTGAYDFELQDLDDVTVKAWENVSAVPAAGDDTFVPLEGDVEMTGQFELSGPAEDPLNPVPLNQVESLIAAAVAAAVASLTASLEPVGAIKEWLTETIPAKHLWLNGDAVSRSTYSVLFTLWGVTFGVGDGTTTFNLPNRMGQFVRGYDPDGTVDPDGGTRSLVTGQVAATGPHRHFLANTNQTSGAVSATITAANYLLKENSGGATAEHYSLQGNATEPTLGLTSQGSGTGTATESRPINVPTIWIVRAQL